MLSILAERALDTMNFDVLGAKPMRIMWSQRDPGLRKSGVGNIFIKNLDKSIDNKVMYDTFSTFGNILSCKVALDEEGKSRGYGFVHFETEEAAEQAIAKINGMLLNDKQVFVGRFVPRKEREKQMGERAKKFTNVFVKNFGEELESDEKLEEMFKEFGPIASAKVAKDDGSDATKSKGFGFVAFQNAEDAEKAVTAMNGKEINGHQLYVGRAQKKAERQAELKKRYEEVKAQRMNKYAGVNLYVKNLDDTIDDEKLKREFEAFGTITSAKVMTDSNGRSKGFGFVCFSQATEATKAVTDMNGKIVVSKPLYVALAQRKDDRRQQLLTQQYQRASQMATTGRQAPAGGPGMPHMHGGPLANPMMVQQQLNPMAAQNGVPGVGPGHNPYMAPNFSPYQKFQYAGPPQHPMQARPRWGPQAPMPRAAYMMRTGPGVVPRVASPGQRVAAPVQPGGRPIVSNQARPPSRHMAPMVQGGRPPMPMGQAGPYKQYPGAFVPSAGIANPPANMAGPVPPVQAAQPVNAVNVQGHEPLTAKMLAGADPQAQKNMLGERLFPLIEQIYPNEAGKITGMLLEIDNAEILHMLVHPESLRAKVDEAKAVLVTQNRT